MVEQGKELFAMDSAQHRIWIKDILPKPIFPIMFWFDDWYESVFYCCRYGEQAAHVTHEGLGAAGHAIGTAWAVFKIRKALNPKSAFKPTKLAKAAAEANSAKLKTKQAK